MGNFFNLGDYLDPVARVWGGGETNLAVPGRERKEVKKEADPSEIKKDAAGLAENKHPEDEQAG